MRRHYYVPDPRNYYDGYSGVKEPIKQKTKKISVGGI